MTAPTTPDAGPGLRPGARPAPPATPSRRRPLQGKGTALGLGLVITFLSVVVLIPLGARPATIFTRIILPNIVPAMAAGTALAFARAMSEFGSTVLISGNLPFKTQVASVHIYNQLESDNVTGAAAVSTVLLLVSLAVLVGLDVLQRWAARRG